MKRSMFWVMVTGLMLLNVDPVRAQAGKNSAPVYGRSQEQEARDHWECHKQAVEQTGYDPSLPQDRGQESPLGRAASQGKAVAGGAMKDAAGSAAVGAAVGAVAGNAGRGAAIGAAGGGVSGLLSGLASAWGQGQEPTQPDKQGWQAYQRVLAACIEVRGHSIK